MAEMEEVYLERFNPSKKTMVGKPLDIKLVSEFLCLCRKVSWIIYNEKESLEVSS